MNLKTASTIIFATLAAALSHVAKADLPLTFYEDTSVINGRNMDYDRENKMFVAHSGWYNNKEIHYYKFNLYAPSTYQGVIAPGSTAADVPLQKVYIMTTTGDFAGVVGMPVVEFHTSDGVKYSDFMAVNFVKVDASYTAGDIKSVEDVQITNFAVTASNIVLNMPIVPTGSKLQSPEDKSKTAPIKPMTALYKGKEVQTFIFEVNDKAAFDFFNPKTRDDPANESYAIPVVTTFAQKDRVTSIPIWHVNQFFNGVSDTKQNMGGPSDQGMRNVINLDRPDAGYSPLWQVYWITDAPVNYSADHASHADDFTADNGFAIFQTPMFVNCPDVGPVGAENTERLDTHVTKLDLAKESSLVIGAHKGHVMQGDKDISIVTEGGTTVVEGKTNMMGAYQLEVKSADVPSGTTLLKIMTGDDKIRELEVTDTSSAGTLGLLSAAAFSAVVMVGTMM